MKKEIKQIKTSDLRNTLKEIIQNEMEKLPSDLEALNPKDRISVICKLMPYIFPKVESISQSFGEPFDFSL